MWYTWIMTEYKMGDPKPEWSPRMQYIMGKSYMNAEIRKWKEAQQPALKVWGLPMGGPDDPRHGTLTGYSNGCRLECCRRANANAAYKRKYGITFDEKEAMLAAQGGKCASCGTTEPGSKRGWHLDHCHDTGVVRSVLCHGCNVALGLLKDDPARIRALADYAESHQKAGF